jgi:putative ABC transport system permease protein
LFLIVVRKILHSKWFYLCLCAGFVLIVAMVASVPIFTEAVLARMLTKDLEGLQQSQGVFPGEYELSVSFNYTFDPASKTKAYRLFDDTIRRELSGNAVIPILSESKEIVLQGVPEYSEQGAVQPGSERWFKFTAIENLENHITLLKGRIFGEKAPDGGYEAIITPYTMKTLDLRLDRTYILAMPDGKRTRVTITGVFDRIDDRDLFWRGNLEKYTSNIFISHEAFEKDFIDADGRLVDSASWGFALAYHALDLANIDSFRARYDRHKKWLDDFQGTARLDFTGSDIIRLYAEREVQLRTILWILMLPVLIVLFFYIVMVSGLIVRNDANGISVLKSRGMGTAQLLFMYSIESVLLAALAFVLGPPLGLVFCGVIGSSNGFLEFIRRTALPLALDAKAYLYSLVAAIMLVVTMMVPALRASKVTIVEHKTAKVKIKGRPFWNKYFIDLIVLAVSLYGLYRFYAQQGIVRSVATTDFHAQIDPLLFATSTLFILGAGLLFLRIYPLVLGLVFKIGENKWSPVFYSSMLSVLRSKGSERFLMLFIVCAVSVGIYGANAARTINRNAEDRVRYSIGADIAIVPYWNKAGESVARPEYNYQSGAGNSESSRYEEPPFAKFASLPGIKRATKVFIEDEGEAGFRDTWQDKVRIMGIQPEEFGAVSWFRYDLAPVHWYNYLNALTGSPNGFIVSTNLMKKLGIALGDSMRIRYETQVYTDGIVYGAIDYWPAYNPFSGDGTLKSEYLVVGNLAYMQNNAPLLPYRIWLSKAEGAKDADIYEALSNEGLRIEQLSSSSQEIIKAKNDPMLLGINGSLTLCFIIVLFVIALGFLIYWIVSIKSRELQFGILRAMGLTVQNISVILVLEQALISGTAILAGILIGSIASRLFVPLLALAYSAADQVPPFLVTSVVGDYVRIYIILGVTLAVSGFILMRILSRIRIDRALKLGED